MVSKLSHEMLADFFTNNLGLLCIADSEGFFITLNPEWERTLGYPLSELEGRRFIDFVHPEDIKSTIEATQKLAENQEVRNFVNRYRHKTGDYRWIEWRSFP